jgi:polyketide cyclase/dehydrase/lipid transport protein
MIVVERTFTVAAAPDAALDYLRDYAHAQDWDPATQRITRTGTGPLVPGAAWTHRCRIFGVTAELTCTLLAAEPFRLVFDRRNEGATCTDLITVRPLPGGTEVTYRVEVEMHGLAKLTTPALKIEFEKLGTAAAAGLSAALDRIPTPPTAISFERPPSTARPAAAES